MNEGRRPVNILINEIGFFSLAVLSSHVINITFYFPYYSQSCLTASALTGRCDTKKGRRKKSKEFTPVHTKIISDSAIEKSASSPAQLSVSGDNGAQREV